MDMDQILDLFNLGDFGFSLIMDKFKEMLEGREEDMVDVEIGEVWQLGKRVVWLDGLGELWDNSQYEESFDLDGFLKMMQ